MVWQGAFHIPSWSSVSSLSYSGPVKLWAQLVPSVSHHGTPGLPGVATPLTPAVLQHGLTLSGGALEGAGCPHRTIHPWYHTDIPCTHNSVSRVSLTSCTDISAQAPCQQWLKGWVVQRKTVYPSLHLCQIQSLLLSTGWREEEQWGDVTCSLGENTAQVPDSWVAMVE